MFQPKKKSKEFYFKKDKARYINVGEKAVRNHRLLLERIDRIAGEVNHSKFLFNANADIGLITRGLTFGHTYESILRLGISGQVHLLNFDMVFPLHLASVRKFFAAKKEVIIIEDQDGFLETFIKTRFFNDIHCPVYGKEYFPKYGEISFDQVCRYLADKFAIDHDENIGVDIEEEVPERLGTFCEGCPHRGSYFAIDKVLEDIDGIIGGDIGCSSLPPFRADWLMCMNAGIGVSQGMAHVLENQVVISTGGDGSFFHAGLISLHSAVQNNINLLHIVFDNGTVAMTGHQDSPSTDKIFNHRTLLKSIGVDRVIEASAHKPIDFSKKLKEEVKGRGVRVIWVKGNCAQLPDEFTRLVRKVRELEIDNKRCGSCTICFDQYACPAIQRSKNGSNGLTIDKDRCMRCGACLDICPKEGVHSSFSCGPSSVLKHAMEYSKEKMGR